MGSEEAQRGALRGRPLSLRQNFSWTFVGNVVYAACQWGMLIALAKLGSSAMVGRFSLGLAVTAPVIMLTNLQLRNVQATDAKGEYSFGDYLGLRLVTTALALGGIAAIVGVSGYGPQTAWVVLLVGVAKGIESVSDIVYGLLQQRERMDRVAQSMVLRGTLSLAAMAAILYVTRNVALGVCALAGSWLIVVLAYDLPNATRLLVAGGGAQAVGRCAAGRAPSYPRPRWVPKDLGSLVWLSLPLGVVMMLMSLNGSIPRYFIQHHAGEAELGIFSALAYLQIAGTTVVRALGQAVLPRLAKCYASGDAATFCRLLGKQLLIGLALGLGGILVALVAGRPLLTLIYKPEYGARADVFVWVMVGAACAYLASFLGYGMTAARRYRDQMPLYLAVVAASGVSCWLLVPRYGIRGAAMSLAIAYLVNACGAAVINLMALRAMGAGAEEAQTSRDRPSDADID